MYSNYCEDYCAPNDYALTNKDRKAILKEKESILEAKLATIRHWIENSEKEEQK